ncbi:MAG TPA: DUF1638 domain-containing protein [Halanaerobiales bacterium]|nr:DUF1638 domain-containing protein [Halanaerobiales bacterium]
MEFTVVACNTLRDEINSVLEQINHDFNFYWIDSGLHNYPNKLNINIQKVLDEIKNAENILLLFGYCGKAIQGIHSKYANIIFPKVDDCISLFLGGIQRKLDLEAQAPAYYFTKGYLENEYNLWFEYKYCINKYGKSRAKKLMKRMLQNYEYIRVIDTKAYQLDNIIPQTQRIAKEFDLNHEVVEGSLELIKKALMGKWDDNFIIKEKGSKITLSDIGIDPKMNNCIY